jgi:hypothetical protein
VKIDTEVDTAHLGHWIAPAALWELIEPMALRWHSRLSHCYCGDAEDLMQSGRLALWEYLQAAGEPERVRELEALRVLDTAFFAELRVLRTGLWGRKRQGVDWEALVEAREGPNEDQRYLLDRFLMNAAKAARKPNWEILWLVRVQQWEPQWVIDYFRRKKDERRRFTLRQIDRRVRLAEQRIRKQLSPSLLAELRRYSWTSEWA